MTPKVIDPSSRKVDFLIAGAQKSGTTALDAYMREHPQICMAARKELHLFDNEDIFVLGGTSRTSLIGHYSVYRESFEPLAADTLLGESTPIYMYWRKAPRRIWEYNPGIKLVVVLRNPILRAFSHWNMERSRNAESRAFSEAIEAELDAHRETPRHQDRTYSYVDRGFYSKQLRRVRRYFPEEQVLVIRHDHLREAPKSALNRICSFLGVDRFETVERRVVHAIPYPSLMTSEEWLRLRNIFEREIRTLESTLGWDCSDWLTPPNFVDPTKCRSEGKFTRVAEVASERV